MTEQRAPLPSWGEIARQTFWTALGLGALLATLALIPGIPGVDSGPFFAARVALGLTWMASGAIWAIAAYRRRRECEASSA